MGAAKPPAQWLYVPLLPGVRFIAGSGAHVRLFRYLQIPKSAMELSMGLEPMVSALPRRCFTTKLQQQIRSLRLV